eukprot:1430202-Pleurochrysis_carterae.AAC.1
MHCRTGRRCTRVQGTLEAPSDLGRLSRPHLRNGRDARDSWRANASDDARKAKDRAAGRQEGASNTTRAHKQPRLGSNPIFHKWLELFGAHKLDNGDSAHLYRLKADSYAFERNTSSHVVMETTRSKYLNADRDGNDQAFTRIKSSQVGSQNDQEFRRSN